MTARVSAVLLLLVFHPLQGLVTRHCKHATTCASARGVIFIVSAAAAPPSATTMMRRRNIKTFVSRAAGAENPPMEKDAIFMEKEALDSIRNCYKYAFINGIVGIFLFPWNATYSNNRLGLAWQQS